MRWSHKTLLLVLVSPAVGQAQEVHDVFYGRMSGDLVLSLDATAEAIYTGTSGLSAGAGVVARARFMDMMGIALGYDRSFAEPRWDALWLTTDLRPTYSARVNYDLQRGPRWLDLMVDSIGLEVGAAVLRPGEAFGRGSGLGLTMGAGIELPLTWNRGRAVMLRLAVRWITNLPWDSQSTHIDNDYAWVGGLGLVFRTLVFARLIGVH